MRNLVMHLKDRLTLLRDQQGVVADDEIRFHLHSMAAECEGGVDFSPKRVMVLDPIVSHAWLDADSFDCTEWAATHPEILRDSLQIVGVFRFDQHWIPILMIPRGANIRIASFDATPDLAQSIAACLTRVTHALGFTEIFIDHIQRTFAAKSVCGAVAINFLRSQLTGCPRLCSTFSAWEEHHFLRRKFMQHIGRKAEVPRPWLWGSGDVEPEGSDDGDFPPDDSCQGGPAGSSEAGPVLQGTIGRVFDVFSPQSDPSLEEGSCPDESDAFVSDNEGPARAGVIHEGGVPRSRSRSPLRFLPGGGRSAHDTVPAPDADSPDRESGPLPIMPVGQGHLQGGPEHPDVINHYVAPLQFAGDPDVATHPRSVRGLFDVGAYSREGWESIEWDVADLLAMSS